MLYSIPKTRMLTAAQNSLSPDSKPRSIFVECMIFLLVTMLCSVPQSLILSVVMIAMIFTDPAYYELISQSVESGEVAMDSMLEYAENFTAAHVSEIMLITLAGSGFMILGAIIYCRAVEKRPLFTVGFNKRDVLPEYLLGIAVGALMISIPALICHLTGCVTLSFNENISPLSIALFFLAFVLQGMGEEAIFRGYFLTTLCRRNREWVAIAVSSLMFAIFHVPNANFSIIAFINITLFGIFAAVFMLKRGSIWAVGAIHTVWNFMQGNIFGFSVSGNPTLPSLFNATDQGFGSILSGGDFGIEGGLGATVVLLAALLLTLMMPAKKSELDTAISGNAQNSTEGTNGAE